MAALQIRLVQDEETRHALAALVRLLARQAAIEHHRRTRDSYPEEDVRS